MPGWLEKYAYSLKVLISAIVIRSLIKMKGNEIKEIGELFEADKSKQNNPLILHSANRLQLVSKLGMSMAMGFSWKNRKIYEKQNKIPCYNQ